MNNENSFSKSDDPFLMDFKSLYIKADDILQAYQSKNLVFFVGAGASKFYASKMPTWKELLQSLSISIGNPQQREEVKKLIEGGKFLIAAEAIKKYSAVGGANQADNEIDSKISEIIKNKINISKEKKVHLHLAMLDFSAPIFTTNYDPIIENLIKEYKVENFQDYAITYKDEEQSSTLLNPAKKHKNYVFKLHGSLDKDRLIFDENDYSDFYFINKYPTTLKLLRHILETKMVIFVGFSLNDPEIMLILREATRFTSSYQHIAFLYEPEVTPIEKEIMEKTYKVHPILYNDYSQLPLYILEMRNFFAKETLPLQLKGSFADLKEEIIDPVKRHLAIKSEEKCSIILFGSFAKYGYFAPAGFDIDILLLSNNITNRITVFENKTNKISARNVEITEISWDEFEKLLRHGDPFASSILSTGCPIEDIEGHYGMLCRGFKWDYEYDKVVKNASNRCAAKFIRACYYRNKDYYKFLRACFQFSISLMQLFAIIESNYKMNSLLSFSLLANPRYLIPEYTKLSDSDDERFFYNLMRAKRKEILSSEFERPKLLDLLSKFKKSIGTRSKAEAYSEFIIPGKYLLSATPGEIAEIYKGLSLILEELYQSDRLDKDPKIPDDLGKLLFLSYDNSVREEILIDIFLRNKENKDIRLIDLLYFFELHSLIKEQFPTINSVDEKSLNDFCDRSRKNWEDSLKESYIK